MPETNATPSELLEAAEEHEERAESLRRDARDHVETEIREQLDFAANIDVHSSGDGFIVEILPDSVANLSLSDEDLDVSTAPTTVAVGPIDVDPAKISDLKDVVSEVADLHPDEPGAPLDEIVRNAPAANVSIGQAEHAVEKLRTQGEIYEPQSGYLRTT